MLKTVPDAKPRRHVRAIFARRGFRRLLSVRLSTQLGDGFFQVALGVSVFFNPDRQVDPLAYAIAFAMVIAPYTLLGPYIGVFLDRWRRRNVLAAANTVRACLLIPVAGLVFSGGPVWLFAGLAMVVITLNRFVLAGLSASQPHVVDQPELVTANAFSTTAGAAAYGAGLGGGFAVSALLGRVVDDSDVGYGVAAAVSVPLLLAAALLAWRSFSPDGLGPDESERASGGVVAALVETTKGMIRGFRHLWTRRGTAYVMGAQAGYRALYGILAVTTLVAFREHFHDAQRFGDYQDSQAWLLAIMVAGQLGALLAAVVTPRMTRTIGPGPWVTWMLAMVAVVIAATGSAYAAFVFVAATFFVNIASQSTKIVVDTSIQSNCDDDYRGRLFSLNDTVFNLSFVIGLFCGALVLPDDGYAPWLLLSGAFGYVCLTGWFGLAARRSAPYVVSGT
ncbi:MAG: MFS transporter [Stackebrandtia sp.]